MYKVNQEKYKHQLILCYTVLDNNSEDRQTYTLTETNQSFGQYTDLTALP